MNLARPLLPTTLAAACLLTAAGPAPAQPDNAAARQAVMAAAPSVVTVHAVLKVTDEDGTEEMNSETNGVVVDPSGLTVVSLSGIDPTEILAQMAGEDPELRIAVSEAKIRLGDGKEIPARIVLRDKNQDLAFLRPTKAPAEPMAAVDLKNSAPAALLDNVVLVGRMTRVANRTLSARFAAVEGVLEKPRVRYILANRKIDADVGSLALSPDGKVVGLVGVRVIPATGDDLSVLGALLMGMGTGAPPLMITTVIPASDIAPVAAQAPAEAPKAAEAAEKPAAK